MSADMRSRNWFRDALEAKRQERQDEFLRSAHHESGHAILYHLARARVQSISLVPHETWTGATWTSFAGVDLVDVLVGIAGGRAATTVFGWPDPASGAEDDAHRERLGAIQLAHLSPHGKATDLEYVDAIVVACREEALRLASEHWQAIDELAKILVREVRVGGAEEVGAMIDRALLAVPAYAAREAAFARDWGRVLVTLGYSRRLRYA